MGRKLNVLGFDPALRNWGMAAGVLDTDTLEVSIKTVETFQPERTKHKQVRQSSTDIDAARQLTQYALDKAKQADVVFVEVPVGSQSAAGMKAYGICIGVLGALREANIALIELTPQAVKLASVGNKKASKQEMIDWAVRNFPTANWPEQTVRGEKKIIKSKAEHSADACAAIVAGTQDKLFQQSLGLFLTTKQGN